MRGGRVEIAGGGIAGLTTACVLAARGWTVRVHERAAELREMGAGIYLKINSLAVLRDIQVIDELRDGGVGIRKGVLLDKNGASVFLRVLDDVETLVVHRGTLHRVLAERAQALGVTVQTNSQITCATPEGELLFADGNACRADLVVGADGVHSRVRDSLGLLESHKLLHEGAIRTLVPRQAGERDATTVEQWAGAFRLGIVPCSKDHIYFYLIGPHAHPRAGAPIDVAFWQSCFAQEAEILGRMDPNAGRHDRFSLVRVKGWSRGATAIIGDAVHAQPPNLGQGAGLAIANAGALGKALAEHASVPEALRAWELARRPITEQVQRWSVLYGSVFVGLSPRAFWTSAESVRTAVIRRFFNSPTTGRRFGWVGRGGHHPGEIDLRQPATIA